MAKAKKTTALAPTAAPSAKLVIPALNFEWLHVTVKGITPLVVHRFSEKTRLQLEETDQNKKKPHAKRDPDGETREALYCIPGEKDKYGIPAAGFKKAMVQVAKDLPGKDINGALIMRQLYVEEDISGLVRLHTRGGWKRRDDVVRLSNKSPQMRYRPEFEDWEVRLRIRYDADIFDAQSVINLLTRAGLTIGWGELRPEKGYTCGTYEITGDVKIVGRKVA